LSTVLIVPLSSSVRATDWRVPIEVNGQRTYALVEQLRAVDKTSRLKERVGSIAGAPELAMIEEELALILGIHPMYRDADE
jgi:mRNA-degrading endonuclease toxin of MazEF toxin-antitoxin module